MRYGGNPEPQNVYGGKSALKNLDLWEPSPAKCCEEFHVSVICQKDGRLMPTNLTYPTLIRASSRGFILITTVQNAITISFNVNYRIFIPQAVAIR